MYYIAFYYPTRYLSLNIQVTVIFHWNIRVLLCTFILFLCLSLFGVFVPFLIMYFLFWQTISYFIMSNKCDHCASAKEPHKLCVRHAPCWKKSLFRPSECEVCVSLFSSANLPEKSEERSTARKHLEDWINNLISIRRTRKFPSPQDIWFS